MRRLTLLLLLVAVPTLARGVDEPRQEKYFSPSQNASYGYFALYPDKGITGIFIYMHGAGGGAEQGISDTLYKGTFARLKKTLDDQGFLYVCPATVGFGQAGGANLVELTEHLKKKYKVPVYISGASAGARSVAKAIQTKRLYAGAIFICPAMNSNDFKSKIDIPVYVIHGKDDPIVSYKTVLDVVVALKTNRTRIQFVTVDGNHDSPLESISWDSSIDFIREQDGHDRVKGSE